MYMNIHAMVFIGFGFLMVFLKTNSWSGVGFNFILACWAIQLNILMYNFWDMALVVNRFTAIPLNIDALITADYGAAACLITFAAITGKCSFPQIFILVTIEMIFYTLNVVICKGLLKAVDVGGGMTIHLFGGYFGVICAFFFNGTRAVKDEERRGVGGYSSNTIAFIGTMFLFMYFPSFNAAMLQGAA